MGYSSSNESSSLAVAAINNSSSSENDNKNNHKNNIETTTTTTTTTATATTTTAEMKKLISQQENTTIQIVDELNNNNNKQKFEKKMTKKPSVKEAKLKSKKFRQDKRPPRKRQTFNLWEETKIFCLPLMPTERDERDIFMLTEYHCFYCDELSDNENLQCKVCPRIAHIRCLHKRGHLESTDVPLNIEWTCSECSDLTKLLADDEVRNMINVFDDFDLRKSCYVKLEDFLRVKNRTAQKNGDTMSAERLRDEERRFRLIDVNNSGSISWNEFVDFESAEILSKKNKVELSNQLTMKELITAKHKFLTYDKDNQLMIQRDDAKLCYFEYIHKLTEKLGEPFIEHMKNCADLLGLNEDQEASDNLKTTAKIMWNEFIRKMTILIIFDRLNSHHFKPKTWKSGVWFPSPRLLAKLNANKNALILPINALYSLLLKSVNTTAEKSSESILKFNNNNSGSKLMKKDDTGLKLPSLYVGGNKNKDSTGSSKKSIEYSKLFNEQFKLEDLMSEHMELEKFQPFMANEFGSYEHVIRSSHLNYLKNDQIEYRNDEDDDDDDDDDYGDYENVKNIKKTVKMMKKSPTFCASSPMFPNLRSPESEARRSRSNLSKSQSKQLKNNNNNSFSTIINKFTRPPPPPPPPQPPLPQQQQSNSMDESINKNQQLMLLPTLENDFYKLLLKNKSNVTRKQQQQQPS